MNMIITAFDRPCEHRGTTARLNSPIGNHISYIESCSGTSAGLNLRHTGCLIPIRQVKQAVD